LTGLIGYTSELFGAINMPLRTAVGTNNFSKDHMELTGAITSGLNKMPVHKGYTYRHLGELTGYGLVNKAGAVVSDMAPVSTAVKQAACANAGQVHEVLEIVISSNGRKVSEASLFKGEEEVLFKPGTRFRVIAAFERQKTAWGTPHDDAQWKINGQDHNAKFAEVLAAINVDSKKDQFRRVIIKEEIK
jgi:hypothetical protein